MATGLFDDFDYIAQNNNDDLAFLARYSEDGGTTFKTGVFLKPSGSPLVQIVLIRPHTPRHRFWLATLCGTFGYLI